MLLFLCNPPQILLQIKILACYTNCSINDKCRGEILEKKFYLCLPKVSFSVPFVPLQPWFSMDELMFGAVILGAINAFVQQTPHQHFQGHLQLWGSLITCQLLMVSA